MPSGTIQVRVLNRVASGLFCTAKIGATDAQVVKLKTPSQPRAEKHFDSNHEGRWVLSVSSADALYLKNDGGRRLFFES